MYAYYHKRSDDSAPRLDDDDITVEVMVIHYLKDGKKKTWPFVAFREPRHVLPATGISEPNWQVYYIYLGKDTVRVCRRIQFKEWFTGQSLFE